MRTKPKSMGDENMAYKATWGIAPTIAVVTEDLFPRRLAGTVAHFLGIHPLIRDTQEFA